MSDRVSASKAWNRARALKLHEHFASIAAALHSRRAKLVPLLKQSARLLENVLLKTGDGGELVLRVSYSTLKREWYYWLAGGRPGRECKDNIRKPEALLCAYVSGAGGHVKMPRLLIKELHRRMTLATGGRDKTGRTNLTFAFGSLKDSWARREDLPGINYDDYPAGCEFPWSYSTICRRKAAKTLRNAGNRGASAHKGSAAFVTLDYRHLRKGELYTLDDVRLDLFVVDDATGSVIEVVCYIFMEVASRAIVGYVMKPAAAIKAEDVDELLAHMLQTPGYGVGVGYVTHILFERGTTACSDAAQRVLEGVTGGAIKVHRTGMVGSIRWIGSHEDKAKGNSSGKGVIESFNRQLHGLLLELPGQRGNHYDNQPQNAGDMGGRSFFARPVPGEKKSSGGSGGKRQYKGTLIDEAERLAQFEIATGRRCKLKLPMLRLSELDQLMSDAIKRHNTERGHQYQGHGATYEEEIAPGVWRDTGRAATRAPRAFPLPTEGSATDHDDQDHPDHP